MLIGLAVGVDYAMFYMRRMTEERDKGRSSADALDVAAATSGRAVLISGFTVMAAMAGMFFSGNPIFSSFGIGTILVVARRHARVAHVPPGRAVLPRPEELAGEGPRARTSPSVATRTAASPAMWNAILDRVIKHPVVSVVLAGGLLVALTIPALGMQFKEAGTEGMSRSQPIIQTLDRIDAAFPGGSVPASVVIKAKDVTTPEVKAAIAQLHDKAIASGQLSEPFNVDVNPAKTVAVASIAVKGKGTDAASDRSLAVLRDDVVPATVGKLQGAEVAVTGMTAGSKDFLDTMKSHLPIVFLFVLAMAFILLLVTFRSIVIPIKAIVLNLLSVGSAYGILTLVFQDGHCEKALGFTSVGGITPWLPLFLFVVLFGLSMDYHVFVLSRVRELVDRGMATDKAVAEGIKSTAGVITSAAAVMVVTFAAFAIGDSQEMKQLGVGLAVAILIDATIVRAVLLPATMKLLGTLQLVPAQGPALAAEVRARADRGARRRLGQQPQAGKGPSRRGGPVSLNALEQREPVLVEQLGERHAAGQRAARRRPARRATFPRERPRDVAAPSPRSATATSTVSPRRNAHASGPASSGV